MWRRVFAALIVLALVGCDATTTNPEEQRFDTESAAYEAAKAADSRPVSLFPEAAEVRLFVNRDVIAFDAAGEPANGTFPARGIAISEAEASALRAAVRDVPPPAAAAACCVPRHAFVFYDVNGRRMGVLEVCFECICARIYEGEQLDRPRQVRWLDWDERAIAAIVEAHGQQTVFEEL